MLVERFVVKPYVSSVNAILLHLVTGNLILSITNVSHPKTDYIFYWNSCEWIFCASPSCLSGVDQTVLSPYTLILPHLALSCTLQQWILFQGHWAFALIVISGLIMHAIFSLFRHRKALQSVIDRLNESTQIKDIRSARFSEVPLLCRMINQIQTYGLRTSKSCSREFPKEVNRCVSDTDPDKSFRL